MKKKVELGWSMANSCFEDLYQIEFPLKKKKQIERQVTDKGDRKQQLLVWINLERKTGTSFYLTTGIKKKKIGENTLREIYRWSEEFEEACNSSLAPIRSGSWDRSKILCWEWRLRIKKEERHTVSWKEPSVNLLYGMWRPYLLLMAHIFRKIMIAVTSFQTEKQRLLNATVFWKPTKLVC